MCRRIERNSTRQKVKGGEKKGEDGRRKVDNKEKTDDEEKGGGRLGGKGREEGGGEKAAVRPVSDYIIALQDLKQGLRNNRKNG